MKHKLSDHYTTKKMLRFTLPSIIMMVFSSIYGVVDGFFISNFAGKMAFAGVNFIIPVIMIMGAIGFMFGAGGSALIGKTLGMGENEKAKSIFSLFVYVAIIIGVILAVSGFLFIRPVAIWLGATGEMLEVAVVYAKINLIALPFYMLQYEFQSFFIVAEKPKTGLLVTVIAGVMNMVLDFIFLAVFDMGVIGAALATAISQATGGVIPLIYFALRKSGVLRLSKFRFDGKSLIKATINGSSELMNNISMSIVSMVFNIQLIHYAREEGVAAYGVLMYVGFIFIAIFIGYSVGISPVISFHYGAENEAELKGLLRRSLRIIGVVSALMLILGFALATPMASLFVGYDAELYEMTRRGFLIVALSYPFTGFAIFGSAFFTALNDGLTSALISFLRTLVCQIASVLILPLIWGIDGIWASIVVAEVMAVIITVAFLISKKKKFRY